MPRGLRAGGTLVDMGLEEGTVIWQPTAQDVGRANLTRYLRWLAEARHKGFNNYHDLWSWSVAELSEFWGSMWDYFEVVSDTPISKVFDGGSMPSARWFEGASINYAERALARSDDHPAVIAMGEATPMEVVTYAELRSRVGAFQAGLQELGVGYGDRVVSYMPNVIDTVVAFLATVGLGAVWSSCSPDFGWRGVTERFRQLEPKVLLATEGYQFGGVWFDRRDQIRRLQTELPSLKAIVVQSFGRPHVGTPLGWRSWDEVARSPSEPTFTRVPFDHPLWILYSSGTTGIPKGIVHSHGGIVLEHLKSWSLQFNLSDDDRLFWHTTTGWMMWNMIVGNLLLGSTIVLYDGSAAYPTGSQLWQVAEKTGVTLFGTSAGFLHTCMRAGIQPRRLFDLKQMRAVASTGSPLSLPGFEWVSESLNVPAQSVSGGTDVCSGFFQPCPLLPIYAGETPCVALGVSAQAFDASGLPVVNEVGELVITRPMPSMPIYLWNDEDGSRYREAYFNMFPGVWRHGDWVKLTDRGTAVIYGRSDSTLNRGGVRIGTSEIYRVVENVAGVADSLVVDLTTLERGIVLFIVAKDDGGQVAQRVKSALKVELSPRHVPDAVIYVSDIPRTLNGKKLEVPLRRVLAGEPVEAVVNLAAVANPEAIDELRAAFAAGEQRTA